MGNIKRETESMIQTSECQLANSSYLSIRKNLPDILLVTFLLISSLKLLSGIEAITDIRLSDESYYQHNGLVIPKEGFPPAEWAPLYSLWYLVLAHFIRDVNPIDLYYLNHKLLIVLMVVGLYSALRAINCNPLISALAGFAVMLSGIPVVWPRPTHFAILFFLTLIASLPLYKKKHDFLIALGTTLLLVSFIRPEYFLSFLVISCLIALNTFIQFSRKRLLFSLLIKVVTYAALAICLILFLGIPTSSGGRGWWAFASHFALRWTWWTGSSANPWTDYPQIINSVFGKVETIYEAMLANPTAFSRFIHENALDLITNTIDILFGSLRDNSPLVKDLNSHFYVVVQGIECLILILIVLGVIWQRKALLKSPENQRIWLYLLVMIGSIGLTLIPVSIIIFPRYHYLITPAILIIILLTFATSLLLKTARPKVDITSAIGLGLTILLLTPSLNYGWCFGNNLCISARMPAITPNVATLRYLQSLKIRQPVNLLAAGFEYRTYLETPINRIDPFKKDLPFRKYLAANSISMVITDPWLLNDPAFQTDAEWQDFLKNPTTYGFTVYPIPKTDRLLLTQNPLP